MAEANGEIAARDPDVLVTEIERTRGDLARTIDQLADRLSPANVAQHALDRAREQLQRPEARMAGGAVAALAVLGVLGVTVYLIRRRRR
jgi:predicted metal-dependent phosphoesterase TrpH